MARILIIEDNPENLELMRFLLTAFGHEPITAGDGAQGLAVAGATAPDLILCDVQMPKLDGYGVLTGLRADPRLRSIPCLAVTALAMRSDEDRLRQAGFDGYISKPIDPETFVAEAQSFLTRGTAGPRPVLDSSPPGVAVDRIAVFARVLVVDDLEPNRELVAQTLSPFGYDVVLARSVSEALVLARQTPPDLIVSDLHMPDEDGFELLRSVRSDARLGRIPFIFLSSSLWADRDSRKAIELGATLFLQRPVEPPAILSAVASLLPPPSSRT